VLLPPFFLAALAASLAAAALAPASLCLLGFCLSNSFSLAAN